MNHTTGSVGSVRAFVEKQALTARKPGVSSARTSSERYARSEHDDIPHAHLTQVEQFVFTTPETSWQAFDDMISMAEDFHKSLKLPYRIMAIVSGQLNNAAAKKYDLEAWFPFQGEYKELVSCSNCTDYQSRGLEIRCGVKTQTDVRKKYVHLLNCTLCATGRALCAIMENYQTEVVNCPIPSSLPPPFHRVSLALMFL